MLTFLSVGLRCGMIASMMFSVSYGQAVKTTIQAKAGGGFQLMVGGQPFFIKAGSSNRSYLSLLKTIGGNSFRTYNPDGATVDRADSMDFKVMMGLPVNQNDAVSAVNQYKNRKSILCWAIGNEEETRTGDRVALWQEMNTIAKAIKVADPNHPVMTVIAEIGNNNLQQIMQYAPDLDFVGINSYNGAASLPTRVNNTGWKKPYVITEFGPAGHWEVPKTPWGLPIEQNSTDKAKMYLDVQTRGAVESPNCLGSVPFLWGQKQEKTHTWYGMFLHSSLGGNPVGAVEAMTYAWTGKYPANRYPTIATNGIAAGEATKIGDGTKRVFALKQLIDVRVNTVDPEGKPLRIEWDLRVDVSDNPGQGGSFEQDVLPIAGAIISKNGNEARIQLPNEEKNYRVFVYVYDDAGNAATANIAIRTDKTVALPIIKRTVINTIRPEIINKDIQGREGTHRPFQTRFEKSSADWKVKANR